MKIYKFSVTVEDCATKGGLISSIIDDVADEKRQSALTYKVNTATSKVHVQVLQDFANKLNVEFEPIGLFFCDMRIDPMSNMYSMPMVKCVISDISYVIILNAESARHEFPDSKYTTYIGDYYLTICSNDTKAYTAHQAHRASSRIESVEDVVKYMESRIKRYLHSNPELIK